MVRALALVFAIVMTLTAADISGLVAAENDGSSVVGAAVTLRSGGNIVAEFETDDSGRFRALGLPAADYIVSVTKASFTTVERRVALTATGADIFLQITKLGVISGRVTDNQGNGIRNFVVAAVPVPADGAPPRVYNSRPKGAVTDASGRYRIFGLPAGDYAVLALAGNGRSIADVPNGALIDTSHGNTADFYPSGSRPTVFSIRSGEQHANIDIKVYSGPLFSIRGTVAGPGPDTPYRVSLVADVVGIPLASAIYQPGKEFRFDRIAPGTYKVVASRQVSSAANSIIDLINSGQIVINSANEAAIIQELEGARAVDRDARNRQPIEPAFAETTVTLAQDLNDLTLSARSGVDVKLSYKPPQDCPSSVQLTLNPMEYRGVGSSSKKLDAGVESPLTGIPSTEYAVALALPESSGCYAVTSLIDFRQVSPGAIVPIVAAKMGRIQGKVDTAGFSTDEFTIVLMGPDGFTKRTFALAKDSSFSIPNVRPERYRLSVSRRTATRMVAADQNVVVESGAVALVEFPTLF
jgi:hypothetical protein